MDPAAKRRDRQRRRTRLVRRTGGTPAFLRGFCDGVALGLAGGLLLAALVLAHGR